MGKVIATWMVKVVAREPDADESVESVPAADLDITAPVIAEIESAVVLGIQNARPELRLTAKAERTDI